VIGEKSAYQSLTPELAKESAFEAHYRKSGRCHSCAEGLRCSELYKLPWHGLETTISLLFLSFQSEKQLGSEFN
jgi:hypothetical protein